ncbi:MAG: hypothetical protein U0792_06680 [Gemmataceae bacterium]
MPYAHVSGVNRLSFTKGLSFGTLYSLPSAGLSTSMRRIFASSRSMRWPVTLVSESEVPSPVVTYISPSLSKQMAQPL